MKKMMIVMAGVAATLAFVASAAPKPKALVVMLDGCRADALENATAPNIRMLAEGRWQPGYRAAWTRTACTILDGPTHSAPNHAAIATGVTAAKTNVRGNGEFRNCDYSKWPSWLVRLAEAQPDKKALFVYSWKNDALLSPSPKVEAVRGGDEPNGARLAKRLAGPDAPDATLFYIDMPDHAGHTTGYYPYTQNYLRAVRISDKLVGGCLKAIASRPSFKDEDWLVIVTADHGGYAKRHFWTSGHTTTIPLVVSSMHIAQGELSGIPFNYDSTPTALAHFGIDVSGMGLDGRAVSKESQFIATGTPRSLKDGLAAHLAFESPQAANRVKGGPVAEMGGKAKSCEPGGFVRGHLKLKAATNETAFVRLAGSENLKFENGADFSATLWVRMASAQNGDAPIFGNKNWSSGRNPGIALIGARRVEASPVPGISLNLGVSGESKRIDSGIYDIDYGKWVFYAIVRRSDGVLMFYQGGADGRLYWIAEDAKNMRLDSGLPFCIGQDGTGCYKHQFNGDIDDFALWTRALSHDDVRRIFESGRQGIPLAELL